MPCKEFQGTIPLNMSMLTTREFTKHRPPASYIDFLIFESNLNKKIIVPLF